MVGLGRFTQRRRALGAFLVGLTIAAVVGGGASAYAYWTTKAAGTSSITTQRAGVQLTGPAGEILFRNDTVDPLAAGYPSVPKLAYAAPVTVRNTGDGAGTVTVSVAAATGDLASLTTREIWALPTGTTTCSSTTPVGTLVAPASAWSSAASFTIPDMPALTNRYYCVRSSISSRISATWPNNGALTLQPAITASINTGGWTAAATPITVTYKTNSIYPSRAMFAQNAPGSRLVRFSFHGASNSCLDLGQTVSPGTELTMFTCGAISQFNQTWRVIPVGAASDNIVTLQPVAVPAMRLSVIPGAELPKDSTTVRVAPEASGPAQQFEVQQRPNNSYQLVSRFNGKCLGVPSSGAKVQLVLCDQANANTTLEFVQSATIVPAMKNGALLLPSGFSVELGMARTSSEADSLKLWYQRDGNTGWTPCGQVTTTAGVARPECAYPAAGGLIGSFRYHFRVTDSTGTRVLMTFDATLTVLVGGLTKSFGAVTNVRDSDGLP